MTRDVVTVAIPVRDGASVLAETLEAVQGQILDPSGELELLVCDSGSTDGSVAIARGYGAEVIEIAPEAFSHGGTRNLLMERARGDHVAFLTQDAVPADEHWLQRLRGGFAVADDVAMVFGPYVARPGASPMVARELDDWFHSISPAGSPRVDRLAVSERELPVRSLLGPRGYFTDANGAVSRGAWERVPFRSVPYAEDHVLAHDMLRAGFSKVYLPEAAVVHSHEYSGWDWLRRSFDEARAMHAVYGFAEPGELPRAALSVWGMVGADWRWALGGVEAGRPPLAVLAGSLRLRLLRAIGTVLGARADRLPDTLVRRLSLEGRSRWS